MDFPVAISECSTIYSPSSSIKRRGILLLFIFATVARRAVARAAFSRQKAQEITVFCAQRSGKPAGSPNFFSTVALLLLLRGRQISLADSSSLLHASHSSLRGFQTVVDTALEKRRQGFPTLHQRPPENAWQVFGVQKTKT